MRRFASLAAVALCFAAPALAQTTPGAPTEEADAPSGATVVQPPEGSPKVDTTAYAAVTQVPEAIAADPANTWLLDLSTGGRVTVQLRPDVAPNHVKRIQELTRAGFYNGLIFHRVIEGFMAQGGDPQGTGQGGSQLPDIAAEFNKLPHLRGAVAMARAEAENSANSQFYITFQPVLKLDRKYTVFGRVKDGIQYVDTIERGEPPANPTRILRAQLGSDNPAPYSAAPVAGAQPAPADTGVTASPGSQPPKN
jgi:cyclophilin family peptidyl-prolyl cis-trans isomerase